MRNVNGLTCHYDTPLITHHLMVTLPFYLSDRAANLLLSTTLSVVYCLLSAETKPTKTNKQKTAVCCLLLFAFYCLLSIVCCLLKQNQQNPINKKLLSAVCCCLPHLLVARIPSNASFALLSQFLLLLAAPVYFISLAMLPTCCLRSSLCCQFSCR